MKKDDGGLPPPTAEFSPSQCADDNPPSDLVPPTEVPSLHAVDARELVAKEFAPLQWAVPGIIPEGVTLLAGAPKVGKSWAALDIAVAIACGGCVFGSIQVDPGEVLYLALEDNHRRMNSRLKKALREGPCPPGLHISIAAPRIDDGLMKLLSEFIVAHPGVRLVIVDTIKPIRPAERKADRVYDTDYAVGRPFLEFAALHHVSVLLLHHTNKTKSEDELDTISGSHGLSGGVDNILVLKRPRASAEAVLYVTGRDIEQEGRFGLFWDQANAMWVLNEDGPRVAMSPERKAIYDLIRDRGPIRSRDLAALLNPGVHITRECREWRRVRDMTLELIKKGLIEKNPDGELQNHRHNRHTL